MEISTIGLDLAKNVFQVHGIDAGGNVVSEGRCVARSFYPSLRVCHLVLSAWSRAAPRIIGLAS